MKVISKTTDSFIILSVIFLKHLIILNSLIFKYFTLNFRNFVYLSLLVSFIAKSDS